jgi:hypothetical protein
LAIALHFEKKENEELRDVLRKNASDALIFAPRYKTLYKVVVIDYNNPASTYDRIESAEADGYKYDKDKSFGNVICLTKWVKIENEEKED